MAIGPKNTRRILEIDPPALEPMQKTLKEKYEKKGARRPSLDIGPLKDLLGIWRGDSTGFNMIALPFQTAPAPPAGFNFRVLMNQYSEELVFNLVDEGVLNRGLVNSGSQHDQRVATIDYQQKIFQVDAEDKPHSGLAGDPNLAIHHEPGLWLYMKNLRPKDKAGKIDIARLASIPHGNSILALGESEKFNGMPEIPPISGLPSGRFEDLNSPGYDFNPPDADPYLAPYKQYIDSPYMGNETTTPGFPGFNPVDMNEILRFHNKDVEILKTTRLTVDTRRTTGGVLNAPFTSREADPRSMKSTFWIQKIVDKYGKKRFRLQYSQVVMLHFFHPREDEYPGRAVWPHISIATLEKDTERCEIKPA